MFAEFHSRCLGFNDAAAQYYASVVAARMRVGRPITVEDAQIAAIALAGGFVLTSRNTPDLSALMSSDSSIHGVAAERLLVARPPALLNGESSQLKPRAHDTAEGKVRRLDGRYVNEEAFPRCRRLKPSSRPMRGKPRHNPG